MLRHLGFFFPENDKNSYIAYERFRNAIGFRWRLNF